MSFLLLADSSNRPGVEIQTKIKYWWPLRFLCQVWRLSYCKHEVLVVFGFCIRSSNDVVSKWWLCFLCSTLVMASTSQDIPPQWVLQKYGWFFRITLRSSSTFPIFPMWQSRRKTDTRRYFSYVWERSNKNLELCKFLVFSYGWIPVTFKRIYYPRDKDPRSVLWDNLATLHTFSWLTPVFWRVD